jgi:hypothetical protein
MMRAMGDQPKAWLLSTIETLNDQIRDVAQTPPSAEARSRGDEGVARWNADVAQTIATLEAAKKVILVRLGPT